MSRRKQSNPKQFKREFANADFTHALFQVTGHDVYSSFIVFIGSTEVDVSFEYFISIVVDQSDVDQKKKIKGSFFFYNLMRLSEMCIPCFSFLLYRRRNDRIEIFGKLHTLD